MWAAAIRSGEGAPRGGEVWSPGGRTLATSSRPPAQGADAEQPHPPTHQARAVRRLAWFSAGVQTASTGHASRCADAPTREAGVCAQYPPPPPPPFPPEPPPPYRTKNAMTTTTSTATPTINHTFLVMFTSPGYGSPSALSL